MAINSELPERVVFTLNRDLIPWVLELARLLDTKPNAMANTILDSVREAVESPNAHAPVRIVEICRRARQGAINLDENSLTRMLSETILAFYPGLKDLEERFDAQLLARLSEHMDKHGHMPDEDTVRRIRKEIGDENVLHAREMREKRKQARQQARRKTSSGSAGS